MVISAQAEPMIRPYFDSGQIKGLVSGLSDAKIYEQSNQSIDPTHQFGLDNHIGIRSASGCWLPSF